MIHLDAEATGLRISKQKEDKRSSFRGALMFLH